MSEAVIIWTWLIVCPVVASLIWRHKGGRWDVGAAFGIILGLIGVILVCVLKPSRDRHVHTS